MKEILITSSALILLLLVLRRAFRGVLSRRVQYALWALVLARLLIPGNLPAVDFSLLTATQPVQQAVETQMGKMVYLRPMEQRPMTAEDRDLPTAQDDWAVVEGNNFTQPEDAGYLVKDETARTVTKYRTNVQWETLLRYAWMGGMVLVGVWFAFSNGRFYWKLRKNRVEWRREGTARRIYLVPEGVIPSPCLFGRSIYITPAVAEDPEKLRHVLSHEETHLRHGDPLWALLRCVCLTIYWFDPLVWAAAACSRTDCELACDEGALARLGEDERIPYGKTLLSLIPVKRGSNPLLAATTMTAGKKQLKDRITRIARKPRQFMAAALAVAVLAGIVSACTFTGGKTDETPEPVESGAPSGPVALTGEELRWFNRSFFNGPELAGYQYNIRNQFANPVNLYDRPEDINLGDLFYCDGEVLTGEEYAALGLEDAACPYFKLTAEEIDGILKANMGLTLEETNKVNFTYGFDETLGAYVWGHGDTNYPGAMDFTCGTREDGLVRLYQYSSYAGSGWYCVTLSEQGDGNYWFVSNQVCEQPAVPTVLPAGEPAAVISLEELPPYAAEAVEVWEDPGPSSVTQYIANWSINDVHICIYRSEDGPYCAAYETEGGYRGFAHYSFDAAGMAPFYDLFGRDGFSITYQPGANARFYNTDTDYYYFDENGVLTLLARCHGESQVVDLDGDGVSELVAPRQMFFQREGLVYEAQLDTLLLEACPELEYWDQENWDRYGRSLYVSGLTGDGGKSELAWWQRYLYFDGENILAYKPSEPAATDHVSEGAADGVPSEVVEQAKARVGSLLADNGDGTFRFADNDEYDLPVDDWRLDNLSGPETFPFGDTVVEVWGYGATVHTTDPGKFVWAGGSYMDEDGWCAIDHSDFYGDLVFQVEGEERKFLFASNYREGGLESVACREQFYRDLEEHGVVVEPDSYGAMEVRLVLEGITYGQTRLQLTTDDGKGGFYLIDLWEGDGPAYQELLTDPEWFRWEKVLHGPEETPRGSYCILADPDWYQQFQVWEGSDLVMCKTSNQEPVWYRAEPVGVRPDDVFYERSRIFGVVREWFDGYELSDKRGALTVEAREGEDYAEIARSWAAMYEMPRMNLTPGSSLGACRYVKIADVEVIDGISERWFPEEILEYPHFAFDYSVIFVPEDEEALSSLMAGNTAEYEGGDPDVPQGAYQYWRRGSMYLKDGVWSCAGVGTG